MIERIKINAHSSIAIEGEPKVYIDPYLIKEASHDADVIFITHDHFDHLSKEDIDKVVRFMGMLGENDDVTNVYHNIENMPEEE